MPAFTIEIGQAMRILFYLPAATPNWFTDHIGPLIRAAVEGSAEVHAIITPPWNGTGISDRELSGFLDLIEPVQWHVLDGPDHPSLRTRPEAPEAVIALAHDIGADYTFCRSADVTTPAAFPGKVVYLMEAEFAPSLPASLPKSGRVMLSGPRLFDFGFMPELAEHLHGWLPDKMQPAWQALTAIGAQNGCRDAYLAKVGLPQDRSIVAVALQCHSADNAFGQVHGSEAPVDRFVQAVAEEMGADFLLAISVHPINRRTIGSGGPFDRIAAMDPARVRIVDHADQRYRGDATEMLVQHCDGLIVTESKAISLGAWYGKPILRLSRFAAADWVNAYCDIATFREALRAGIAAVPNAEAMRLWYAWHFTDQAFVAAAADLTELIDRVERAINPNYWARALMRHNLQF